MQVVGVNFPVALLMVGVENFEEAVMTEVEVNSLVVLIGVEAVNSLGVMAVEGNFLVD